jgi:hypothetical protein
MNRLPDAKNLGTDRAHAFSYFILLPVWIKEGGILYALQGPLEKKLARHYNKGFQSIIP